MGGKEEGRKQTSETSQQGWGSGRDAQWYTADSRPTGVLVFFFVFSGVVRQISTSFAKDTVGLTSNTVGYPTCLYPRGGEGGEIMPDKVSSVGGNKMNMSILRLCAAWALTNFIIRAYQGIGFSQHLKPSIHVLDANDDSLV